MDVNPIIDALAILNSATKRNVADTNAAIVTIDLVDYSVRNAHIDIHIILMAIFN